ncbi:hypothetical protein [Burkholderia territorii]|uniref:hypothetical protein n=1 Tax=Burkholderia territorii TaxID=1503055 RepID=UPI0007542E30|nr:hypothetical protein [Burkholderia territorii]KVQ59268.1 hypothetical protein WT22_18315 [Burkholderia territorii]KWA30927.1 hypothetical protein WT40_21885 [Burkholderia territorii]
MYKDLYIETDYDGKDLMSVVSIFTYDDDGEVQECRDATNACCGIVTCADQGVDLWRWLRSQVQQHLEAAGISFEDLYFEDDRGNAA